MKKLKYLPLLGVGLLALAGCSSSAGEVSRKKARRLYDESAIIAYNVYINAGDRSCSFDNDKDPEVISKSDGTSVEGVTNDVLLTDIYEKLYLFYENPIIANDVAFFNNVDDNCIYPLAGLFQEKPTYNLDGKKLTASFTGSMKQNINDKDYGFAMNFEAKFNKHGLLTNAEFELVVATDLNKQSADTKLRYTGQVKTTIQEVH